MALFSFCEALGHIVERFLLTGCDALLSSDSSCMSRLCAIPVGRVPCYMGFGTGVVMVDFSH